VETRGIEKYYYSIEVGFIVKFTPNWSGFKRFLFGPVDANSNKYRRIYCTTVRYAYIVSLIFIRPFFRWYKRCSQVDVKLVYSHLLKRPLKLSFKRKEEEEREGRQQKKNYTYVGPALWHRLRRVILLNYCIELTECWFINEIIIRLRTVRPGLFTEFCYIENERTGAGARFFE
jgi:hypothetical protein